MATIMVDKKKALKPIISNNGSLKKCFKNCN